MSVSEEKPVNWRPDARAVMEQLRPVTQRLEAVRQEAIAKRKRAMTIALSIGGASVLAALVVLGSGGEQSIIGIVIAVVGGIIGLLVFSIMGGGAKRDYRNQFKADLFSKAVSLAVPGMEYFPSSMVPKESFVASGLFRSRIDKYNGEDCFRGKCGATELLFSELHVIRRETSTDSKGRSTTRDVTVFKGIYLIADFHKDFNCRVLIEPDVAEANFGWIGRKLQGISGNLVRLENPEFEKAFKVTASDQLAARYLLTPDMQERFLALRSHWSPGIRAVMMDSCLHLAIPKNEDWFEPNLSAPADDIPVLHSFLVQLMMVLHITEKLDLNTRIWTKD